MNTTHTFSYLTFTLFALSPAPSYISTLGSHSSRAGGAPFTPSLPNRTLSQRTGSAPGLLCSAQYRIRQPLVGAGGALWSGYPPSPGNRITGDWGEKRSCGGCHRYPRLAQRKRWRWRRTRRRKQAGGKAAAEEAPQQQQHQQQHSREEGE